MQRQLTIGEKPRTLNENIILTIEFGIITIVCFILAITLHFTISWIFAIGTPIGIIVTIDYIYTTFKCWRKKTSENVLKKDIRHTETNKQS